MTEPEFKAVQKKLDETLAQLKDVHDPERKRTLLKQMRSLMAELEDLVFDQSRFPKR